MKLASKFKKIIALNLIVIFLFITSFTNSSANSIGTHSSNQYKLNTQVAPQAAAKSLLKAAAFAAGFIVGVGVGLTEGWNAAGQLVDALDGQERITSFNDLNYDSSDLSKFDI